VPSCVRAGCRGVSLAPWWHLCVACTTPLLEPVGDGSSLGDQQAAAGWDAVTWAERIAPNRWGNAVTDDGWVTGVRCLALAAVVTGRADGCQHTAMTGARPVVAVPRATGSLRCPSCAEAVVASVTTDGHACDRCGRVPVTGLHRTAAVAGSSLIIVTQLCDGCASSVLALGVPGAPAGSA
jgi:hypothetical protein